MQFYIQVVGYLYLLTIKTGQQSRFFSFSSIALVQPRLYILSFVKCNIYLPEHNYITYSNSVCVWPHNAIVNLSSRDNIIIQLPTARRINVSCCTVSILYKLPSDCGSPLYSKSHVLSAQQRYGDIRYSGDVNKRLLHPQQSLLYGLKLDNPSWYKHWCFVNFRAPRSANSPPK